MIHVLPPLFNCHSAWSVQFLPGELSGEHCGLLMYEIRSGTENEMCS